MDVLVTGAAGFIGSHLAERLAAAGHRVVGVDSFADYYAPALKALNARRLEEAGVEVRRLDLAQDNLADAVRGAEAVFHVAAQPGISAHVPFEDYLRNNVVATHRLVEAAAASAALGLLVNVSTSSVYGADADGDEAAEPRPTSFYGVTKLAAEQLVMAAARERGLPACSFRLFSVYGPRERPDKLFYKLIRALFEGRPFPLFEGSEHHQRSYTYVADAVAGLEAALDAPERCRGEIFNLGNDQTVATGEGIRLAEELVGRQAQIERRGRRAGDQLRTHANIEKARRVLGYAPATPLREGLARQVAWYADEVLAQLDA